MPIQTIYRGIPQPDLASYDWYDLATGTGYKDFYGMDIITGTDTLSYVLSTRAFYSSVGFKSFSNLTGEINFDLELEVPITIEGVTLLNIAVGSQQTFSINLSFKLYSVDENDVETQLGSTVTDNAVALANNQKVVSVKFNVPITRIKAGEKIRLCVINPAAGAGNALYWYFDPKDRSDLSVVPDFITSNLILSLPIKI